MRLVIVSIGEGLVAKADEEIYVLSTIKMFSYSFICFLCCTKEGRVVENIKNDVNTLKILTTM